MFGQFSGLLFIHISLILIIILIFINVTPHAHALLSIIFILLLFIILYIYDLALFAIILLSIELHTIYIVFCLLLMWSSSDSVIIANLKSSEMSMVGRVIIILLLVICYVKLMLVCTSVNYYNIDLYTINIIISQYTELTQLNSGASINVLGVLAHAYLSVNSLEFLLVNIYMFLALFVYHVITYTYKRYCGRRNILNVYTLVNSVRFNVSYTKRVPQDIAILRVASIYNRCSNVRV